MGANPEIIKNLHADETIFIKESKRLGQKIIDKALSIIHKNKDEKDFSFYSVKDDPGSIVEVPSMIHIVRGIEKLRGKDNTIMLLGRDRYNLSKAKYILKENGIPCGGSELELQALRLLTTRPEVITRYDIEILINKIFPSERKKGDGGLWVRGAKTKIEEMVKEGFSPRPVETLKEIGATEFLLEALDKSKVGILNLSAYQIKYYKSVLNKWDGNLNVVSAMPHHGSKGKEADIVIVLTDITQTIKMAEQVDSIESERRVWYVAMTRAKKGIILVGKQGYYKTGIV